MEIAGAADAAYPRERAATSGNAPVLYSLPGRCERRRHHELAWGCFPMDALVTIRTVLAVLLCSTLTTHAATTGKRAQQQAAQNAVYAYGPGGPNRSYQSGPRTRIYVSRRSWLDGGTEVLPGERKFTDYAFPPGASFARSNNNRPLDRQPLSPDSDLGGFAQRIPISW